MVGINIPYLQGGDTILGEKYKREGMQALQYQLEEAKRKVKEALSRSEMQPVLKRKATFSEKLRGKKDEYTVKPHVIGMSGRDPLLGFAFDMYTGGRGIQSVGKAIKYYAPKVKTLWNNGKLILKDIPRKAENFYRAVNKDAINDAKKYGIIRGRESRVGDSYPFFGRSSEPYHDTKYVIEGTPESADWISTYKYVYSKNPEIVKLSKIPDRDYSKAYDTIIGSPESNGFLRIGAYDKEFLEGYEALPMTNGQLNVSPSSNFAYWKKHPIIGWRKHRL